MSWRPGRAQHRMLAWVKQWHVWRQHAKARRYLSQLPDHLLQDMGLHQTDLRLARGSHHGTDFLQRLI
ncbi:MAG: DUF1127 domain-containing protein [Gammaproteobacteria bacterium]